MNDKEIATLQLLSIKFIQLKEDEVLPIVLGNHFYYLYDMSENIILVSIATLLEDGFGKVSKVNQMNVNELGKDAAIFVANQLLNSMPIKIKYNKIYQANIEYHFLSLIK